MKILSLNRCIIHIVLGLLIQVYARSFYHRHQPTLRQCQVTRVVVDECKVETVKHRRVNEERMLKNDSEQYFDSDILQPSSLRLRHVLLIVIIRELIRD